MARAKPRPPDADPWRGYPRPMGPLARIVRRESARATLHYINAMLRHMYGPTPQDIVRFIDVLERLADTSDTGA